MTKLKLEFSKPEMEMIRSKIYLTDIQEQILGMAYDYKINEELATDIVHDMKPLGELWSMDTIKSVVGEQPNLPDIYVVMNSLANDYKDVIPTDDVETYVKMTTAWLNDIDAKPNKVWKYFVN